MTSEDIRKYTEATASFGLLALCVALIMPIVNLTDPHQLTIYKWIYAAGALIFTIARTVGATDKECSRRLRRLYRIEFWAGVAFIIAAAFWFYQEEHLGIYAGVLAVLQPVITLSLAGAMIQIIAGFMISKQVKKESKDKDNKTN